MGTLKLLLWIASLYACLQAHRTCNIGSLKVKQMKRLECEQDSTFYTPQNVETQCLTAALHCARTELMTARQECRDPKRHIDLGIEYLDYTLNKDTTHTLDGGDCPCEMWPTANFTMFLEELANLCYLKNTRAR